MLSMEKKSFSVTLEKFETNNPNYKLGLHFLQPDINVPLHCTNLIKQGSDVHLHSNSRIFTIVTVQNILQKQFDRFIFIPTFNTEQTHTFDKIQVKTLMVTNNFEPSPLPADLPNLQRLHEYIKNSIKLVRSTQPADIRLTKLHSVAWKFTLMFDNQQQEIHVPYVCLVCRGDVLVNSLPTGTLSDIQHFFMKEFTSICHDKYLVPSQFMELSKKALVDAASRHSVYMYIANFFSSLVYKHIRYMTDYQATGKKDFIGINEFDNHLYSDCEDMAQASYDLMRIFRRVFPSSLSDVQNNISTLCYHVSAWLNEATLGIMQGALGEVRSKKLSNHVWAVILPKETPAVFVEGTKGDFTPNIYQHAIRFWSRDSSNIYDFFLINPDTGQYGMSINFFLSSSFPMKAINQWALKLNTTPIYRDLLFVANMQVETFNLLNYLIKH